MSQSNFSRKNSWHRYDMSKLRHCHTMYTATVHLWRNTGLNSKVQEAHYTDLVWTCMFAYILRFSNSNLNELRPKVQPGSLVLYLNCLTLLRQNPTPTTEISQIEPWLHISRNYGRPTLVPVLIWHTQRSRRPQYTTLFSWYGQQWASSN